MNYEYHQTDLSRALLAGLFAGIVATVANLVFDFVFRSLTRTVTYNILDVSTTIFGSILLLLIAGVFFYFFVHYIKKGVNLYRVAVAVITALVVVVAFQYHRGPGFLIPHNFRLLFIGTQVIIGALAAFLIPYLFRHDKFIS